MTAPDKIYVEVCEDGIFAFPKPPFAESVEYVRADLVKPTLDEDGKAMLHIAEKSYKIGFRDGKASKEQPVEDLNNLIRKWDKVNINTIQKARVKATGEIIDGFYDGRGHFDHFVDHDVFDRYSIEDVEPIIDEQPVEGLEEQLEKEMDKEWLGWCEDVDYLAYCAIARHFAQWGAEHLKR